MVIRAWFRRKRLGLFIGRQTLTPVLAFMLLLGGCGGNAAMKKRQAEMTRDTGERFLQAGEPTKALNQFVKALEDNPDDPYLHYDLALAYDLKGAREEAEYHLKEAIRLKPDYSSAYNYLGVVYFRSGRVNLAIQSYEKALSNLLYMRPQSSHFNLGVAYLSLNEYDKAVHHLREAIRIVPDYAEAYYNLGRAYEGLHRNEEARRAYRKAVEFEPENPQAHLNLGKMLYRAGERRAALESFKEVIRLAPDTDMAVEARRYLDLLE